MKHILIAITFLILIFFGISNNQTQCQLLEELNQQKHVKLSKELLIKYNFNIIDSVSKSIIDKAPYSKQATQWYYSENLNAYVYEITDKKFTKFFTYYSENSWWWQDNSSQVIKIFNQLEKEISQLKQGSG